MKQPTPLRRGRKPLAEETRRTMQIRLSIDEKSLVLDGLTHVRSTLVQAGDDLQKIDVLIDRVATLE